MNYKYDSLERGLGISASVLAIVCSTWLLSKCTIQPSHPFTQSVQTIQPLQDQPSNIHLIDSCATPRPYVAPQKVIKKDIIDPYVAPAAIYPAYGPGYNPSDALLLELIKGNSEILKELREMRLDAIKAGIGGGGRLPGKTLSSLEVKQQRCASCHSESTAADKGRDFVLVMDDGTEAPIGPNDLRRITKRIASNGADRMPPAPGQPLTPEERQALSQPPPPPAVSPSAQTPKEK